MGDEYKDFAREHQRNDGGDGGGGGEAAATAAHALVIPHSDGVGRKCQREDNLHNFQSIY